MSQQHLVSQESQEHLASAINAQFSLLADLLQDNAQAYKKLWEINREFIRYTDNTRLLLNVQPKELIEL